MPVLSAEMLREGLSSEYANAYTNTRRASEARMKMIVDMGQSSGRTTTRGYFEAAPHARYQPQGDPITAEGMASKAFTIVNYPYSLRIDWHKDDREDDRTGSLKTVAQQGGASLGLLPERFLFDYLNDSASTLPAIGNAADGIALWSASTRFEVATGNSLTVSSWSASGPAARGAIWTGEEQFHLFKDGKGQPLFTDDVLDSPTLIIHAAADMDIFAEALQQGIVAYANSSSNAGVDNPLMAYGKKFIPWVTSRIATGTFFMAKTGTPVKPFILQERTAVVESYADDQNSDLSKNTGQEFIQWRQRLGFGAGLPYGLLKIA